MSNQYVREDEERRERFRNIKTSGPKPVLSVNTNRYPGRCFDCGDTVKPDQGRLGSMPGIGHRLVFCMRCSDERCANGNCL